MYHVLALCITADDICRFVLFSTCVGVLLSQIRFEFSYISTHLRVRYYEHVKLYVMHALL